MFSVAWHNDVDGDDLRLAKTLPLIGGTEEEALEVGRKGVAWFADHHDVSLDKAVGVAIEGDVVTTLQPTGFWIYGPSLAKWISTAMMQPRNRELLPLLNELRLRSDTASHEAAKTIERQAIFIEKLLMESSLAALYSETLDKIETHFEKPGQMKTGWRENDIHREFRLLKRREKRIKECRDNFDDQVIDEPPDSVLRWNMQMLNAAVHVLRECKERTLVYGQNTLDCAARLEGITRMEFLTAKGYWRGEEEVTSELLDEIRDLYREGDPFSLEGIWTAEDGWIDG